jgi:hypothetical protein
VTCSLPSSLVMTVFRGAGAMEGSFSKWNVSSVMSMNSSKLCDLCFCESLGCIVVCVCLCWLCECILPSSVIAITMDL